MDRKQLQATIENAVLDAVSTTTTGLESNLKSFLLSALPNEHKADAKAVITDLLDIRKGLAKEISGRVCDAVIKKEVKKTVTKKKKK